MFHSTSFAISLLMTAIPNLISKKQTKQCSTIELVHDVVEEILQKLPPKSLFRFKSVSKQWKSTIESPFFQHKHLTHYHQKSKTPHLLSIIINNKRISSLESIISIELESSISRNIPIPWENSYFMFCQNSIDGLVCLYDDYDSVVIFNPTTRWYRTLPPSTYQQRKCFGEFDSLGFGKDEINGLYKPVWLYNNSSKSNSNNATTCEVFDFKTKSWRSIEPSSPKRIRGWGDPVYLNGLLYWLTEEEEEEYYTNVLSFDFHTETFEIVCKTPFENCMIIYNLNDELCISDHLEYDCVIWSLNFKEKTWKKIYSIDYSKIIRPLSEYCYRKVKPLVLIEEKKRRFMLCNYYRRGRGDMGGLILYDSQTTSYRMVVKDDFIEVLCYFPSLISII